DDAALPVEIVPAVTARIERNGFQPAVAIRANIGRVSRVPRSQFLDGMIQIRAMRAGVVIKAVTPNALAAANFATEILHVRCDLDRLSLLQFSPFRFQILLLFI